MILGFNPISTRFQSPKHVIKAKDPRLALIEVAVPEFLNAPPPPSTQDVGLPTPLAAKLFYSYEQPILSDKEPEEPASEPTQAAIERDFEVFYYADSKKTPEPNHRPQVTT